MITLDARPDSLRFDPAQSALIVVDMQNAYATKGYLDTAGFDVSATAPVIEKIQTAVAAAREAGMLIIWFQNGWDEQYVEAGGRARRTGTSPTRLRPCANVLSYRANCWRKAVGITS